MVNEERTTWVLKGLMAYKCNNTLLQGYAGTKCIIIKMKFYVQDKV